MYIEISKHARQKMVIHGITKQQIEKAIQKGSKFEQTDGFLIKYSYIRVAYKRRGDAYKIKTVYVE